jgi:chromate transporter
MTDPFSAFLFILKASLLSSGGLGNLPSLHQDLLSRGWATNTDFAASLAVGQISPGPGGLWVVALGYLLAGIPGGIAALVAITLPPLLVIPIGRLHRRFAERPIVRGFTRGIILAVAATVPLVFLRILASYGINPATLGIALGCFALLASRRLPVIAVVTVGAVGGLILLR